MQANSLQAFAWACIGFLLNTHTPPLQDAEVLIGSEDTIVASLSAVWFLIRTLKKGLWGTGAMAEPGRSR